MIETVIDAEGHHIVVKGRYGYTAINRHDQFIGRAIQNYGECNEIELTVLRKFLKANDVVFDIGANIGNHMMFFSQAVGAGGHVYCFEPQTNSFHLLCCNKVINSLANVTLRNVAVGNACDDITVPLLPETIENNFGAVSLVEEHQSNLTTDHVKMVNIDSLPIARLDLMKVDVEGMEIDVIIGAASTIERHQPILYVENDREQNSRELVALIRELGYVPYWALTPLYNPENYAGKAENIFPNIVTQNMLCTPKSKHITIQGLSEVEY